MTWEDDVITLLSPVATLGVTLFTRSLSYVPSGDGPFLLFRSTGGSSPELTQNDNLPAFQMPGGQILGIGKDPGLTNALVASGYSALFITNQTVNGTRYRRIRPLQEPYDLGIEETSGRFQVVFNVLGDKSFS